MVRIMKQINEHSLFSGFFKIKKRINNFNESLLRTFLK